MKAKIKQALSSLKDFQRSTVDYVYGQLYQKGRNKMLIADEVGLGKTIVAKGIIVRAFEQHLLKKVDRPFRVVYICSNQAIAHQNLRKLNFTHNDEAIESSAENDRVTDLAYRFDDDSDGTLFRIKAFTPATSFNDRSHAGKYMERVLLFRLLYRYADLAPYQNSLKWMLKATAPGKMHNEKWENIIERAVAYDEGKPQSDIYPIRGTVSSKFRELLENEAPQKKLQKSYDILGQRTPVKYWTLIRNH